MSGIPDRARRKAVLLFASALPAAALGYAGWSALGARPVAAQPANTADTLFDEVTAKVLPERGFQSRIRLGEAVVRLREHGVIDRAKFTALYADRGGVPPELERILTTFSDAPMLLTRASANYYVNLLWPLGLANYMAANAESPLNGKSLPDYASTSGWNLGREPNGAVYFNKLRIVALTPDQEALAARIAKNTYRPCCNNPTFFQDCNHGSALLGLLELGAAQGLRERELYSEALAFNSFWFPRNYVFTALYFKAVKNLGWEAVDARTVMGFEYSALGPWAKNVEAEVAKIPNLVPQRRDGAGCAV